MGYISELRKHIGHNPLISAGATVAVIKDKQILLNLRSDTKTWGIPGGSLEIGETLEETAKRELKEETNLDCDNFTLLNVFSGNDFYFKYPNGDELYSVIALYLADDFKGSLKIIDDESIDLSFFSKSELPNLESRANFIIDWLIEKEYI
ncbi:NUDIX hydrolase [Eubacterium sp.]